MTSGVAEAAITPVPRERGWGKIAIATAAFVIVPLTPLLRVLLPVEQSVVLLAPALAALAVAGWRAGGRATLAVMWTLLAAWVVWQVAGGDLFAVVQGGWALLAAGAFGGLALWRREVATPFMPQALRAVALALLVAAASIFVVPGGPTRVSNVVAAEAGRRADASRAGWHQMTDMPEWKEFVAQNPSAGQMAAVVDSELTSLPATTRALYPSLAALEALIALALAWALYHRVGRARLGPPLGRLRDFRFNDQLVWGVVAGLALVLVPGLTLARVIGANLLVFFGALYTIRGVGVFLWMLSPGRLASTLLIVVAVLFWNILGVMALGLGVGDTWLDWRARARPKKT